MTGGSSQEHKEIETQWDAHVRTQGDDSHPQAIGEPDQQIPGPWTSSLQDWEATCYGLSLPVCGTSF